MNQRMGGLLAICILLGCLAFGVLFVAPRYIGVSDDAATGEAAEVASMPLAGQDEVMPDAAEDDGATQPSAAHSGSDIEKAADVLPDDVSTVPENSTAPSAVDALPGITELADIAAAALGDGADADVPATDPTIPQFDLLRVEPDGSAVVAGRGQPGRQLDILSGEEVIASVEVGPTGDFAAVLDEPLAPGAHSLTLEARGEDDELVRSEDVATVSIPERDEYELLAMISRPGEASRIVSRPEPTEAAENDSVPASAVEPDVTGQPESEAPELDVAGIDEPAEEERASPEAPPIDGDVAESDAATIAPDVSDQTNLETAETVAPADEQPASTVDEAEPAELAALSSPSPQVAERQQEVPVTLHIDAVEIEGDQIFVAGASPPLATVRAYAGETVIGDSLASEEGRFLVEGRVGLSVGEHSIRADLIEDGRVIARAIVPFHRPEGEMAAAVAQSDGPTGQSLAATTEAAGAPPTDDVPVVADADVASAAEAEEAGGDQSETAGADVGFDEPGGAREEMASAETVTGESSETVSDPVERETAHVAESPNDAGSQLATPSVPSEAVETAAEGEGPVTVEQAALTPTDESVIIRRGDTLWQISRRVYGQGVRYTTIYLANQEQIANPDRILPGQIFSVPEHALENAEQLHRERLLQ